MTEDQRISFVIHGKIHGRKKIVKELQYFFSEEFELRFYETQLARHSEGLAIQALTDGCDYLIAVGGDGTLNEVVNGFMKSGGREKHKAVLGVLPWGTGNDFVRTVGVSRSVEELKAYIMNGSIRNIDAGKIFV